MLIIVFFTLGFVGGVLSGWLGIGGGVVMAPLLLYVPAGLNLGSLSMKEVAGLTMAQGFFAALSGGIAHRRHGLVSKRLVLYMGSSIVVGSSVGSIMSKFVSAELLKGIFATLAIVAAGWMFVPQRDERQTVDMEVTEFDTALAILIPLLLGFLLGMVGQAGAFILIPVMLHVLKIPTRVTIGSSLGIVLLSASAGLLGKLITGQVPILQASVLVLGALAGAQVGGSLSVRTKTRTLRLALALLIGLAALGMWYELLGR